MTNPLIEKSNEALLDMPVVGTELEFMRRQTVAQQEAGEAAKQTAVYTRKSARYMLASVIILALSSLGTFVLSMLTYCHLMSN